MRFFAGVPALPALKSMGQGANVNQPAKIRES